MKHIVALAAASVLTLQLPTFRSGVDAVTVDVSVRDNARVVTGLGAQNFEVFDNGVLQDVAEVSYGKLPIDVTMVLDVSFSVTGPLLERLREAVRQLMRDLGPADRLKLIDFNMRVRRAVDFTSDPSAIQEALQSVSAGGGSSIWDVISVALVSASHPGRRQLIVIFSDGVDTTSITAPDSLIDLARRTNASVASVVPGTTAGSAPLARAGIDLLRDLGKETGGTVIAMPIAWRTSAPAGRTTIRSVSATTDLTATFRRVLDEFRSSYVLHFTPKGVNASGFHTLEVKVKGRPSLTIRARRGYTVR